MNYNFIYQEEVSIEESKLIQFMNFCTERLPEKDKKVLKAYDDLTIVLVGKEQIQSLNNQFRQKDKPTDILSFAGVEPASAGELVICYEVITQQAAEHDLSVLQELCYMLIHGLLHLLDYDHETDDTKAEQMYRLQDSLFNAYFGDVNVPRN